MPLTDIGTLWPFLFVGSPHFHVPSSPFAPESDGLTTTTSWWMLPFGRLSPTPICLTVQGAAMSEGASGMTHSATALWLPHTARNAARPACSTPHSLPHSSRCTQVQNNGRVCISFRAAISIDARCSDPEVRSNSGALPARWAPTEQRLRPLLREEHRSNSGQPEKHDSDGKGADTRLKRRLSRDIAAMAMIKFSVERWTNETGSTQVQGG